MMIHELGFVLVAASEATKMISEVTNHRAIVARREEMPLSPGHNEPLEFGPPNEIGRITRGPDSPRSTPRDSTPRGWEAIFPDSTRKIQTQQGFVCAGCGF